MASNLGKANKAVMFYEIANVINGDGSSLLPPWEGPKFYILEPEPGVRRTLICDGNNVVRFCSENAITAEILRYCHDRAAVEYPAYGEFTEATARAAMMFYISITDPLKREPAMVCERSEPGLCFHRLDFDIAEGPTPIFDEFLSRVSNADALQMFIGSLFDERSDRQQYVWLHGDGMNGKGALLRFLRRVLGPAFAAKETPVRDDKFWNQGLLGKRLIALPDCDKDAFPASQKFKMLTGGDAIPIEPKGKDAYTADINCKFIIASNEKPCINGQKSNLRRAIYCECRPIEVEPDVNYDNRLYSEAAGIVFKCIDMYNNYTKNSIIPNNTDSLEMLVEETEAEWERILNWYFVTDPNDEHIESQTIAGKATLTPVELAECLRREQMSYRQQVEFRKWLRIKHGVTYRTVRDNDGCVTKAYVGVALRKITAVENEAIRPFRR